MKSSFVLVLVFTVLFGTATGQTITYETGGENVAYEYTVSDSDAANVGSGLLSAWTLDSGSAMYGSSLSRINNGLFFEEGYPSYFTDATFTPSNGAVVTVSFVQAITVASISTYAASGSGQVRSGQDYQLEYRMADSPIFFTLFSSLDANDPNNIDASQTSTKVVIDFSSFMGGGLQNVDALRFTFANVGVDGETMYREIDVVATIPEPGTSVALFAASILAVFCVRRHRKHTCLRVE